MYGEAILDLRPWKVSFSYDRDCRIRCWQPGVGGRKISRPARKLSYAGPVATAASVAKFTDDLEAPSRGANDLPHRRAWRGDYRRAGHDNFHVLGYREEGTTTTPFDMCVLNDLDRFHLVSDVIDRVPGLKARAAYAKQTIRDKLIDHRHYICRYGDDMPEITGWRWGQEAPSAGVHSTEADNV